MSCTPSGPNEAPWRPLCSITGSARQSARRRALVSQMPSKGVRAEPVLDYASAVSRLTAT